MAQIEIERKFRVLLDPVTWSERFEALAAWELWQGYLTEPGSAVEVRVRRVLQLERATVNDFHPAPQLDELGQQVVRRLIAVKHDVSTVQAKALSRREVESDVDEAFFQEAWGACRGRRLRKLRIDHLVHVPPDDFRSIVLDVFLDRLEGLVVAETEFETWQDAERFHPPDFLGREVTGDERYRNVNLAVATAPPD